MPATFTETPSPSRPRSYDVKTTDESHLVRNRRLLVPAKEEPIRQTASSTNVPDHRSSISERPRRVTNKPKRLIESISSIVFRFACRVNSIRGRCYITACAIPCRNILFHHVAVVTSPFCTLFPCHLYHNGHSVLIYSVCH